MSRAFSSRPDDGRAILSPLVAARRGSDIGLDPAFGPLGPPEALTGSFAAPVNRPVLGERLEAASRSSERRLPAAAP